MPPIPDHGFRVGHGKHPIQGGTISAPGAASEDVDPAPTDQHAQNRERRVRLGALERGDDQAGHHDAPESDCRCVLGKPDVFACQCPPPSFALQPVRVERNLFPLNFQPFPLALISRAILSAIRLRPGPPKLGQFDLPCSRSSSS